MTFTELIPASSFFADIGKHTEDIDDDPTGEVDERARSGLDGLPNEDEESARSARVASDGGAFKHFPGARPRNLLTLVCCSGLLEVDLSKSWWQWRDWDEG